MKAVGFVPRRRAHTDLVGAIAALSSRADRMKDKEKTRLSGGKIRLLSKRGTRWSGILAAGSRD